MLFRSACAAPIAGLRNSIASGEIDGGLRIVAVMTGLGLKDPETAARMIATPRVVPATLGGVRAALGW